VSGFTNGITDGITSVGQIRRQMRW
jgi:hypothetical protein